MLKNIKKYIIIYGLLAVVIVGLFAIGMTRPDFFTNLTGAILQTKGPTVMSTTGATTTTTMTTFGTGGTVGTIYLPVCGDGKKEGAETCDDGNTVSGDGCSKSCTVELVVKPYQPVCGNGKKEAGEECDGSDIRTTCEKLGYESGTLKCSGCQLDTSECVAKKNNITGTTTHTSGTGEAIINTNTPTTTYIGGSSTTTNVTYTDSSTSDIKITKEASGDTVTSVSFVPTITVRGVDILCNKETKGTLLGIFCLMKGY